MSTTVSTIYEKGTKYFHANSTEPDSVASGTNSIAVGPNAVASGENSVAMGNGAMASAPNSVALGSGSVADRANTVSVGSVGNERQITNVAPGTAGTDAVNVDQLRSMQNNVNSEIKDLKHGVAAAMAMQMPTLNIPGRVVLHTGVGHYDGATSYALTGKYTAVNKRWNLGGGVSVSGGKVGVAAGADFVMDWGHDYHENYNPSPIVPVIPAGGTLNTPLNPTP